jgi:dTDP-glucose 4,6-dehydratase/UDP-glucuronate decarboxylase
MRILVAGGAGMIGSHLCEHLLALGHEVHCLDNLVTGRLANLQTLLPNPAFRFIQHDVTLELPPLPCFDRIYHLASPASPVGYTRFPIETLRANSEGTLRLLGLALQGPRFLYTSTSEIYGDPLQHPQHEDYRGNVSSIGPRSMYDEAKRYGEALTMAFVRSKNVDARLVRIFNTYGPRADRDDGRLVANLVTQALAAQPMTIYGDGKQTRSLCYVSDMIAGLVQTMESPAAQGQVVNLGNPDERTVLEVAHIVRELTASTSEFVFTPPAVADDPQVRCPDIRKAQSLMGWSPTVAIREGLSLTIQYFREAIAAERPALRPGNGAVPHRNGAARDAASPAGARSNGRPATPA